MKRRTVMFVLTMLLLALLVLSPASLAQASFSGAWWTVDGGGGQSSSNDFSLNAVAGQPDAGAMTGGRFSLQGGFFPSAMSEAAEKTFLPVVRK